MLRRWVLLLLTIMGGCLFVFLLWHGWGKQPLRKSEVDDPMHDPVFRAKINAVFALMRLNGSRPYTQEEMAMLHQLINTTDTDPDSRFLRSNALFTLSLSPDPQQRKEAIRLAIERLKDPAWIVRSEAIYVLAKLRVKEAVPHILPLLNDPKPEVREDARKALQRLGYRVP